MATAKATITKTPVVTTTYVDSKVITLELTECEAETLRHVMSLIGGSMSTRHGDTHAIGASLQAAGVTWLQCTRSVDPSTRSIDSVGTITFEE